jgi:hypothetical protein
LDYERFVIVKARKEKKDGKKELRADRDRNELKTPLFSLSFC